MKPKKEYVLKLSDFDRRLLIGLMTQIQNALLQRIIRAPCRNVEVSR